MEKMTEAKMELKTRGQRKAPTPEELMAIFEEMASFGDLEIKFESGTWKLTWKMEEVSDVG